MAPVSLCLILKKTLSSPITLEKPAILTFSYSIAHLEKVCPHPWRSIVALISLQSLRTTRM